MRTICVALVLGLMGCTSSGLSSTPVPAGQPGPQRGAYYWLPKKLVLLDVYTDPRGKYFAAWRGTKVVPDNRYLMRLSFDHSINSEDDMTVSITEEGYLSSVNATTVDKTDQIVLKMMEIAKAGLFIGPTFDLLARAPGSPGGGFGVMGSAPKAKPVFVTTIAIDPIASSERELLRRRYGIKMGVRRLAECDVVPRGAAPCGADCVGRQPGVCYRPVMPYEISIEPGGFVVPNVGVISAIEKHEEIRNVALLPNEAPILCFPIRASAFGTGVSTLEFSSGMLTKVATKRPSELLGFLSIPASVLSEILKIPGELLTIRIENNNKVPQLVTSEVNRLEALERFAERLSQLQSKQATHDMAMHRSVVESLSQEPGRLGGSTMPRTYEDLAEEAPVFDPNSVSHEQDITLPPEPPESP